MPIASASANPLIGCKATAATMTIHSTLTTKRDVSATTDVFPERCASCMNTASASQAPNITAAARMWMNFVVRIRAIIGTGRRQGVSWPYGGILPFGRRYPAVRPQ